jgi:putative acetyltransferase
MITITRTNSDNPDFIELVRQLDADLALRDGADHSFYAQFNKIDKIRYAVVAYKNSQPAGIGALREYTNDSIEVKRMYVQPEYRGEGIATAVLSALELWARELGFDICILETGKKQPEAISLYQRSGYSIMPNYGQYENVANSVCMRKQVI